MRKMQPSGHPVIHAPGLGGRTSSGKVYPSGHPVMHAPNLGGRTSSGKVYEYDGTICEIPEKGGAYVAFPWDLKEEFGKRRVKVHATFDGIPYDGSVVNMGVKNADGSVCYIIGILKSIRKELGKGDGDVVHVVVTERE